MIHLFRLRVIKPQTMKKQCFSFLILLPLIFPFSFACTKNNDVSRTATGVVDLLQNKWILNSVRAYPTRDFSGTDFIGFNGNGSDYYNFSNDGNIYSYTLGIHDTSGYKLLPNDSTILIYQLKKGIKAEIPDTVTIITIAKDSLVWWHKNPYGDYGRFSFRK